MEKFRDWGTQQFGKSVNQSTDIVIYLTCELFSGETREIEDSDNEEGGVRMGGNREINGGKKELWPIEEDKSHWAILLVYEKTPCLADLKDIIRAMLTHAYRESIAFSMHKNQSATSSSGWYTNNETVSVPWGQVGENPAAWLKSWDNDILVKEPSKIKIKEARDLYTYWLNRQKKRTIVLEFIKANKNDIIEKLGKRKKAKKGKKPEWVKPGSEEEPEQTAEGKGKAREIAHTSPENQADRNGQKKRKHSDVLDEMDDMAVPKAKKQKPKSKVSKDTVELEDETPGKKKTEKQVRKGDKKQGKGAANDLASHTGNR